MDKSRIFFGYWILLSCCILCFITMGCSLNTFTLFIGPFQESLGWNRTQIMAAFTILVATGGITAPFSGRLLDTYGAKKVICAGSVITTTGLILLSQMNSLWQLYLGYSIIGIGMIATGPVSSSLVVSHWFKNRRGRAIGIMSMGMTISGILFAPFVAIFLIPHFGWRNTYMTMAAINFCIIIPLALIIVRTTPAEMGLFPDGRDDLPNMDNRTENTSTNLKSFRLKSAVITPAFWFIAISLFLNHTHLGIFVSVYPHLIDLGFNVKIAASTVSIMSGMALVGMYFFGWLCDRIKPKYAAAIGLGVIATAFLIFVAIGSQSPVPLIWLLACFLGFGAGSWLPTMSMLTSTTFGMAYYGSIFGAMSLFQYVGGGVGPLIAGRIYDSTNSYDLAAIIIGSMVILAIPLVLSAKRPSAGWQ